MKEEKPIKTTHEIKGEEPKAITNDGTIVYPVLYEVPYVEWSLWGTKQNVDVAYISIKNIEDPNIIIEKLVYKLGLAQKKPLNFKNSLRRGVKLLGTPRKVEKTHRLEP